MNTSQTKRLIEHFRLHPNEDIPAPELHRIGSGKEYGYCASFTRRITECRDAGMNIILSRDERIDGQRHTAYRYAP